MVQLPPRRRRQRPVEYYYIRKKNYSHFLNYGQISSVIQFFLGMLAFAVILFLFTEWTSGSKRISELTLPQVGHMNQSVSLSTRSPVVIFAMISRTGFELLEQVMKNVLEARGIKFIDKEGKNVLYNTQESFIAEISSIDEPTVVFANHLAFVDFARLGAQPPIWISLICDPIVKLISHYLASQRKKEDNLSESEAWDRLNTCVTQRNKECVPQTGTNLSAPLSFFCGLEPECKQFKSVWANHQARSHLELWYPVIGQREHLNETLKALEMKLPSYFSGLSEEYMKETINSDFGWNYEDFLTQESISILREVLHMEFALYDALEKRLYQQIT